MTTSRIDPESPRIRGSSCPAQVTAKGAKLTTRNAEDLPQVRATSGPFVLTGSLSWDEYAESEEQPFVLNITVSCAGVVLEEESLSDIDDSEDEAYLLEMTIEMGTDRVPAARLKIIEMYDAISLSP